MNNSFREKGENSGFGCSFLSGFRSFGGHEQCFDEGRATAKARCKRKMGRRAVQVSECVRRGGGDGKKTPCFSLIIGTYSAILGNFSGHFAEFSSGRRTALRRGGKKTRIHILLRGAPGDGVPRGGVRCRDVSRRRVIFGKIRARRAPYAVRRVAFRRGNFVYQPENLKFAD